MATQKPYGDPVLLNPLDYLPGRVCGRQCHLMIHAQNDWCANHWVGAGFDSRKNPDVEGVPPTVPSTVGRQALGIKVHFNVVPICWGRVFATPRPLP